MSGYHIPVLLHESVDALVTDRSGIYVDATFGGGGHSAAILEKLGPKGRLLAFDQDKDAIENNPISDTRLTLIRNNFRFIRNFVLYEGHTSGVDGVLADLGVSSHQFDTADRGFSFRFDAPLDMRMNSEAEMSAADILNGYGQDELEKILRLYGEVENSRKIAALVCKARDRKSISTTGDLYGAISPVLPKTAERYAQKAPDGSEIGGNLVNKQILKLFERAGITTSIAVPGRKKKLTVYGVHSFRHSFASHCAEAGIPRAVCASILGADADIIDSYYVHIGEEAQEKAIRTLSATSPQTAEARISAALQLLSNIPDKTDLLLALEKILKQ